MRWRLGAAVVAGMCSLAAPVVNAADRVTLRPPNSGGLVTVTGEIVDYTDETLTIRTSGGGPAQVVSTSEVAGVETYRSPAHLQGLEHHRRGEIDAAVQAYEKALETEGRAWMRREVLAELVKSHVRQGDLGKAAARFVQIAEVEPHHRHWGVAPLLWAPEPTPPILQAAARRWLVSSSDAVRLVGAGLSLDDTASRVAAVSELKRLERGSDRYLGSLAQALLWSANLQTKPASVEELRRWQREIERMPASIRGGPWYVLGRMHLHRNEPEEASAAFLKVFLVHTVDEELAAKSGLEAGLALERVNRHEEGRLVLAELIERYPWTRAAAEARAKLSTPTPAP